MFQTFISRKQYSLLIDRFPIFMSEVWPENWEREWLLSGVLAVTNNEAWHHALKVNLSVVGEG